MWQATISNDGAELMSLLDIVHPAAKTMVDISQSQDAQIGDGTTTVVIIAAALMNNAKQFVEDGMHPMIIISVSHFMFMLLCIRWICENINITLTSRCCPTMPLDACTTATTGVPSSSPFRPYQDQGVGGRNGGWRRRRPAQAT